ncbi:MAG: MBL fold metallo-hydrolase [Taibaiella sp.]|nr:MBL fold metallo-hydrolase [Taibaiella sp.]
MSLLKPSRKEGKKFMNPVPTEMMTGSFWNTLRKYMTVKAEVIPKIKPGPFHTDAAIYNTAPASGLRITWIGHSSLLIEIDGRRLLTDPVWAQRASPVSFAGPRRFFDAPIELENLPALDAIILSHDHYDHLDRDAIIKLVHFTDAPAYCSLGVAMHLVKWGMPAARITEMDWMDSTTISNLTLTALPARHFSGRGMTHRNETLWSSFVIKGDKHNIYFGADSGFHEGFKEIGDKYGPFDLTLLEIGAYNENWADIHMGPENAANAHIALMGKVMMPIHWGTFNLALHAWTEPVERLLQYAAEKNITLMLPVPGIPTEVPTATYNSEWWKKR